MRHALLVLTIIALAWLSLGCQTLTDLGSAAGLTSASDTTNQGISSTFVPAREVAQVAVGKPLALKSHHINPGGMSRLAIKVNDEPVTLQSATEQGAIFFGDSGSVQLMVDAQAVETNSVKPRFPINDAWTVSLAWTAFVTGTYQLSLTAADAAGTPAKQLLNGLKLSNTVNVDQFNYDLPPDLIAQTPLEPRHASRLMVVNRHSGDISHRHFTDLVDLLSSGDIVIANDSRVIPARLLGRKTSGGQVEILLLKRLDSARWEALVGGKRLKPGVVVKIEPAQPQPAPLALTIIEDLGDSRRLIEFNQPPDPWLDKVGHAPLPPYIHTHLANPDRYQTIFSRVNGSAAAPTAGLHFTPEVLLALRDKEVGLDYVTLHIGLDTFKPVTVEQVEAHVIHREMAYLSADTARHINQAKLAGGRLLAVGTTAARTLETAALRAVGVNGSLRQVSTLAPAAPPGCPWQPVTSIAEETDLFIYPGFTFRAVDALLTNFHLPKSTLLMLVSAFAGRELILHAYHQAIAERYRFYSFGDAMLII